VQKLVIHKFSKRQHLTGGLDRLMIAFFEFDVEFSFLAFLVVDGGLVVIVVTLKNMHEAK